MVQLIIDSSEYGPAFRLKMRNEVLPCPLTMDPTQFEEKIVLTRDIADVLRKNIVQARKIELPSSNEDRYRTSKPLSIFGS